MSKKSSHINRLRWTALFLRFVDFSGQLAKRTTGLSLTQARILIYAICYEGKAMTSIARALNLKAPATTAAVDGLERLGFARREVSSDDGRSFGVYVTEAGYAQVPGIVSASQEAFDCAVKAYGEEATREAIRLVMPGDTLDIVESALRDKDLSADRFCELLRIDSSCIEDGRFVRLAQTEALSWAVQAIAVVDSEYGLGSKAAVILRAIEACGGEVSLKELRRMLMMKPVAMTAQVNYLEEAGLITRSLDVDDRRLTLVSTTTQGASLVTVSRDAFTRCFDQLFPGVAKVAPPEVNR